MCDEKITTVMINRDWVPDPENKTGRITEWMEWIHPRIPDPKTGEMIFIITGSGKTYAFRAMNEAGKYTVWKRVCRMELYRRGLIDYCPDKRYKDGLPPLRRRAKDD